MSLSPHDQKHLETRLAEAQAFLRDAETRANEARAARALAQSKVQSLQAQAERAARLSGKLLVTEHAILRYAQRVLNLDVEGIETAIRVAVEKPVGVIGNGKFPITGTGTHAVVKDGKVVTVA